MNRDKVIAALNEFCENTNGCTNCVIEKESPFGKYCVEHLFEEMATNDLLIYARIVGVADSIEDTVEIKEDPVNHPSHYTSGGIECIDAIAASMTPIEYAGFLKGQVLKYVWRYRLKGKPHEDLKKARYYLEKLILETENNEVS